VNHTKRGSLFLTITLILTDFYSFYILLIVKKFHMLQVKFTTSPDLCACRIWKNLKPTFLP